MGRCVLTRAWSRLAWRRLVGSSTVVLAQHQSPCLSHLSVCLSLPMCNPKPPLVFVAKGGEEDAPRHFHCLSFCRCRCRCQSSWAPAGAPAGEALGERLGGAWAGGPKRRAGAGRAMCVWGRGSRGPRMAAGARRWGPAAGGGRRRSAAGHVGSRAHARVTVRRIHSAWAGAGPGKREVQRGH